MRELLHDLADAVTTAVRGFEGDLAEVTGTGADGTPTQVIDRIAEDAVLALLDERKAAVNLLSEEAGFVDRGGSETIVLDPVDGTYNAVRGLPLFATSIAVGGNRLSTVTHALVRDLAHGDTYYAERGGGAFLNGRAVRTRPYRSKGGLISVYLGQMAEPAAFDVARSARRVRNLGAASLDLCAVASGAFDVYYMNSRASARLRIVDIAAGVLIVREAGGAVVDPARRELDVPFSLTARTNLVAVGDRRALEDLP